MQNERKRSRLFSAVRCAAIIAATLLTGAAEAQSTKLALPQEGFGYLDTFIAKDAGIWRDLGLDVEIVYIRGTGGISGLLSGSVDFANISAGSVARVASRGQPLEVLANLVGSLIIEVVIRKDHADAAKLSPNAPLNERLALLRGKTIATAPVNTIIYNFLKVAAGKAGMNAETDMRLAVVEEGQNAVVALERKQVDAMVQSPPWTQEGVSVGGVRLIGPEDLPEFNPFGFTLLVGRPGFCAKNEMLCQKMVTGVVRAARFIHERPEETMKLLEKRFPALPEATLRASLKVITAATLNPPTFEPSAMQNAIRFEIKAGTTDASHSDVASKIPFTNKYLKAAD